VEPTVPRRRLAELAGQPISLALVDIDDFKQVNDGFSHDTGDTVLRRVAELLRIHVDGAPHADAFAARLGGDEFVLAFPGTDSQAARRQCERVRTHLQATEWAWSATALRVTLSIGFVSDDDGRNRPTASADAGLPGHQQGVRRCLPGHCDATAPGEADA
jgi:two-component system cell cycle response regulator